MDTSANPKTDPPESETNGYAMFSWLQWLLYASAFCKVNAMDAVPAKWEERPRKAWEYYVEEPLVKKRVNSWHTFALGDEIKITSNDEKLKEDAVTTAWKIDVSEFIKDMILQLLWGSSVTPHQGRISKKLCATILHP